MRADIRKKNKSREGNRICRKNKESSGRNWGSTEKSTRENKATSRQRKERSQEMEER